MIEQKNYLTNGNMKKKYPNPPGKRKEWTELDVQKKMLAELRRIADTLENINKLHISDPTNVKLR